MQLSDKHLSQFLDWVGEEIEEEINNPGTTICRDMYTEVMAYFDKRDREVPINNLIDIMVYNVVEEFMDRPFNKALANLNFIQEYNRYEPVDMLLILPLETLVPMLHAKKNNKRIALRYTVRNFFYNSIKSLHS